LRESCHWDRRLLIITARNNILQLTLAGTTFINQWHQYQNIIQFCHWGGIYLELTTQDNMKYTTAILLLCISVASETASVSAAPRVRRHIIKAAASEIYDDNNSNNIPSAAAAPRRRRILQAKEMKEKKVKLPKKKDKKEDPMSNDGVNSEIDGNVPINQAIMDGMDNPLTQFFLEDLKAPSNDQNATIDWGDSFVGSESPSISPSSKPTTKEPSLSPITSSPTTKEPTPVPSPSPTLAQEIIPAVITNEPTTKQPTNKPITVSPTNQPSKKPVTAIPTLSPSNKPITNSPTLKPSIATPVSISGVIYNDKNENGRLDPMEDGVGGIIVRAKSCLLDRTVGHAFSKPDGSYILRDVGDPGCYYLQFVNSDRYYFVSPKDGMTENINLKSGQVDSGWNAGVAFYPTKEPTLSPVRLTKSPVTSEPSSSPSNSPVTNKPSVSPSVRPTTDKPTNKPSLVPTVSITTYAFCRLFILNHSHMYYDLIFLLVQTNFEANIKSIGDSFIQTYCELLYVCISSLTFRLRFLWSNISILTL